MKRRREGLRSGEERGGRSEQLVNPVSVFSPRPALQTVQRGRVMNPGPKRSSSSLMMEGTEGGKKGISLMKSLCVCVCVCVCVS